MSSSRGKIAVRAKIEKRPKGDDRTTREKKTREKKSLPLMLIISRIFAIVNQRKENKDCDEAVKLTRWYGEGSSAGGGEGKKETRSRAGDGEGLRLKLGCGVSLQQVCNLVVDRGQGPPRLGVGLV